MSIPDYVKSNFATLLAAAENGDLALMECLDAKTAEARYVICAVSQVSGEYQFTPFGHMAADVNPFEAYVPPAQGHG